MSPFYLLHTSEKVLRLSQDRLTFQTWWFFDKIKVNLLFTHQVFIMNSCKILSQPHFWELVFLWLSQQPAAIKTENNQRWLGACFIACIQSLGVTWLRVWPGLTWDLAIGLSVAAIISKWWALFCLYTKLSLHTAYSHS